MSVIMVTEKTTWKTRKSTIDGMINEQDVKNRTKEVRLFGVKLLTITKDYRFNREEADSL